MRKEHDMSSYGDPIQDASRLYTQLGVIAAYPEHPNRSRAGRAAATLRILLEEADVRPVEPDVDPVFGPADNPLPVSELDRMFDSLFHDMIRLNRFAAAHAVNRAWTELDESDPGGCRMPVRRDAGFTVGVGLG